MRDSDGSALSLTKLKRHGGVIRSTDPLSVETGPAQWEYAVSVAVTLTGRQAPLDRLPLQLSISVHVESGTLGCLLVGDDWKTLCCRSPVTLAPGRRRAELVWEGPPGRAHLVFRNHGAGGLPCVFTVESVELGPVQPDAFDYSARLDAVRTDDGQSLDIARLREAVEQPGLFGVGDDELLESLRRKWSTVPAGLEGRRDTSELIELAPGALKELWQQVHREATTGQGFAVRGWYQALYRDVLRGKKVLEIGSGFGIDGIPFARDGARMTFVDIVEGNLRVMERLCEAFGVRDAAFVHLDRLSSLEALDRDFDVVWCQGSLINVPFSFARRESAAILPHLKPGGRWIELAYPRERWVRDGRPTPRTWAAMTDGEGTPWMEWYDLAKLHRRLAPVRFETVLALNFHDDDFNWFDLVRSE